MKIFWYLKLTFFMIRLRKNNFFWHILIYIGIENQILSILRNYIYSWATFILYYIDQVSDSSAEVSETRSETSDNLSQSSSENAYSLKRQNTFAGKLTYALRTKTIDVKDIVCTNIQGKAIVKSYQKHKSLSRQSRMLIVDIILTELLNETIQ